MKQKNLILVAVAVGCGLVAAFLTSQMRGETKKVDDSIEVPVAARDLPVGMKIGKDELKQVVAYKKFSKESLPAVYAATEEELAEKRLIRTVRAGEPFNPQDLTTNAPISPPPGFNMITFPATAPEAVAGFAGPGSRVDVIASVQMRSQNNRGIVFPLFVDMLILAIDTNSQFAKDGAFSSLSMVSLAVTNKQAMMLQGALSRGAQMRLVLRNHDKPPVWDKIPTEEEVWEILADDPEKAKKKAEEVKEPETPKVVTVKLPVPTEDLPAGTQLTAELIEQKFKMIDFTPPAPANVIQDLREHTGRYLLNPLGANQFVPKTFVGDKVQEKEKPVPAQPTPAPAPAPKPKEVEKTNEKPPVYYDATIQTSTGVKKYRYQKLDNGDYKFLGEIPLDNSPDKPAAEDQKTDPDAKPAPKADPEQNSDPKPKKINPVIKA